MISHLQELTQFQRKKCGQIILMYYMLTIPRPNSLILLNISTHGLWQVIIIFSIFMSRSKNIYMVTINSVIKQFMLMGISFLLMMLVTSDELFGKIPYFILTILGT